MKIKNAKIWLNGVHCIISRDGVKWVKAQITQSSVFCDEILTIDEKISLRSQVDKFWDDE